MSPEKMSWVQPRGGRETRKPRGGLVPRYDSAMNQKTYQPSGEGTDRHIDVPHRSERAPELQPGYCMPGQQTSPYSILRNWPPGWHEERSLADSDTLPACWRHEAQPAKKEPQDINQQNPSRGPKVHFQRPAERRQRSPEDDDEDWEIPGSSSGNSLGGSLTIVEKSEGRPDDQSSALSHSSSAIEDEVAGSVDEDGYVHVLRGSPHVGALEKEDVPRKA